MNKDTLYVVKFRRPATQLERKQFELDRVYDCAAFFHKPFADEFIKEQKDADEVEIIVTDEASYNDLFLNRPDDEINFYKTGELNLVPINEAIEVGVENASKQIDVYTTVDNPNNADVSYTATIDESTKDIVITPTDPEVSFKELVDADGENVEHIHVVATLLADKVGTDVDTIIDNIGQIVISPKDTDAEFISATIGEDLNLVVQDEPLSEEECATELASITDNYQLKSGEIVTYYREEMEFAAVELEKHYDSVTVDAREGTNETIWTISFSGSSTVTEALTEAEEIASDEEGEPWTVKYSFEVDESLQEESSVSSNTYTLTAKDATDALKYAEQFARMQARENDTWKSAEVVSIQKGK